jgi:RNA polymerase sigma-70 factor, ECF subfamily
MSRLYALRELPDRELLSTHCAGDPDAFGELFRRHRDQMWALALRITRDPEVAADAVQEAFIAAFRGAGSFRGEAAVTTWLHRIVVNSSLDRLRRIKPVAQLPDADLNVLADPADHHRSVEIRIDVRAALDQLPEGQRMALVLVDMHGLSVAEAARVLSIAEGTVKSRCSRGRAAMVPLLGLSTSSDKLAAPPRKEPPVMPPHKEPMASP